LSAILQALTRYSANNPQFPVNDRSLFTGKSHVVGGADDIQAIGSTAAAKDSETLALRDISPTRWISLALAGIVISNLSVVGE
jgi:hypothetical protein